MEVDAVAALSERLALVEDQLAIHRLLMSHPPAADSSSIDYLVSIFTEDGEMDLGERDPERHVGDAEGVIKRSEMVETAKAHEFSTLIASGAAHCSTAPVIDVRGDEAFAWNYTQLLGFEDGSFRVRRVVANRWELRREGGHWRIARRTLRLINGSTSALDVLREAVDAMAAVA